MPRMIMPDDYPGRPLPNAPGLGSRRGEPLSVGHSQHPHNRRRPTVLVLVAVALLVGACSDGGGDGVETSDPATLETRVLPFELVQATDLTFEPDPADPTRGIFRVETTEAMICAIVWGPDERFGRFNNSLAMDGTGITQHDVFLPDVEPGRQYRFVVQGTTADGTLYRSRVGTFTIDADPTGSPTTSLPVGDNLATDATITAASSEFSPSFAAANAIDGDTGTEWATAGDGDDGFIAVDLGAEESIAAVEYLTRSMSDGSATTLTYTVTVDDGEPVGPFAAGTPADRQVHPVELAGRHVRIDVESSTGGNVGAIEVRLHAP